MTHTHHGRGRPNAAGIFSLETKRAATPNTAMTICAKFKSHDGFALRLFTQTKNPGEAGVRNY
jgi:hypothetical protein